MMPKLSTHRYSDLVAGLPSLLDRMLELRLVAGNSSIKKVPYAAEAAVGGVPYCRWRRDRQDKVCLLECADLLEQFLTRIEPSRAPLRTSEQVLATSEDVIIGLEEPPEVGPSINEFSLPTLLLCLCRDECALVPSREGRRDDPGCGRY
jgi:hypothetical protein